MDDTTFAMTDEEIKELGRVTLYGPLPPTTTMRLLGGAVRIMDERNKMRQAVRELVKTIGHHDPYSEEKRVSVRLNELEALADVARLPKHEKA